MNENLKFTITIPAFKAKYLKESIESCLQQTYTNFEVVIVNDASPENIDQVVKQFKDERILYFVNERNCGAIDVVDNWNICLSHASGDYVICMGDDDMLLPNCLEEYCKLIAKYPGLGVYHGWTEIIDENSVVYDIQQPRPEYESALSLIWNRWNGRPRQYIGDFCFDTKILKEDGGFYKLPLAWASDDISAIRAASRKGIANTQVPIFLYRVNRLSISTSSNRKIKVDSLLLEKNWIEDYLKNIKLDQIDELDKIYFHSIVRVYKNVFDEFIRIQVIYDLKKSNSYLYWFLKRKKINFSLKTLFLCFAKSLNRFEKVKPN